ncbi:hypothetical protein SNEBB_006363 [Seison nebaliae]|nr:hypothetical protein SNEBB_006363 [Seison nebaliae]
MMKNGKVNLLKNQKLHQLILQENEKKKKKVELTKRTVVKKQFRSIGVGPDNRPPQAILKIRRKIPLKKEINPKEINGKIAITEKTTKSTKSTKKKMINNRRK